MKFDRETVVDAYGENHRLMMFYVLPDHDIAYMPTPKVGCSSLKLLFERIYRDDPHFKVGNVHTNRTVPRPLKVGWDVMHRKMRDGSLYGFGIARDPIKRAVSGYCNKLKMPKFQEEFNAILGRDDPQAEVSFDQFIEALERQDPHAMNPHWRPQHSVMMVDVIQYDHIGKLETMDADMAIIKAASKLPNLPVPYKNKGRKSTTFDVTPAQKARLEQIYAQDFETFGY